ncbi:hypothetical protein ABE288_14325 [Bacillus salipaludis]|uniref:hypothetical protein n=1 Tax=Bacillus salipaludis TaxID=2547811 RepID=UPI003D1C8F8B
MDEDILKTDNTNTDETEIKSNNKLVKDGGVALGGTALAGAIKVILSNEKMTSAIADTIKENKKTVIVGSMVLTGLYILKEKKIKFIYKDQDRQLKFETE